jgi:hypothetical protein
MPKVDISMTADEVAAFLARCAVMVIGTIDPDGWPNATLAHTDYDDNGNLTIDLDEADPVSVDIERTGALCCVADQHEKYFEIRGVIVHGRPGRRDGAALSVDVTRIVSFDFARLQD